MSAKALRKEIAVIERALNVEDKEPKDRLDLEAMTDRERFIVKGAMDLTRAAMRRAMKEQNVKSLGDVDINKVFISEEDQPVFEAYAIIERKYAVTRKEYSRRHPIH